MYRLGVIVGNPITLKIQALTSRFRDDNAPRDASRSKRVKKPRRSAPPAPKTIRVSFSAEDEIFLPEDDYVATGGVDAAGTNGLVKLGRTR